MYRLALILFALLTFPAQAEDSSFKAGVMESQAEILAFVDLCDFRFNRLLADAALPFLGIEFDQSDHASMKEMADKIASRLRKYDRKALCLAGEIMYGPEGLSSADMISLR